MKQTFFTLVPDNSNFQFIKKGPIFFIFASILMSLSVYFLATKGLNYGVDFKGGTEIYLRFAQSYDAEKIRSVLKPIGYEGVNVQRYGNEDKFEFLIGVQPEDLQLTRYQDQLQNEMQAIAPNSNASIRFSEERIYVTFDEDVSTDVIEAAISQMNIADLHIQYVTQFGKASQNEYLVQFAGASTKIIDALKAAQANFEVLQIEEVGQKVGSELRRQAVGAILISLLFILVYIWFRFDFEFAPGAILSLIHDVLLVLGIFALFQLSFDLATVAAMLTVVGFSINDTIVIYDRIRENLALTKNAVFEEVVNQSINQTLSRTLLTSITLLMATGMLLFFGGVITKNFALALSLGVIVGSYSSIFIASPLTIYLYKRARKLA